MALGLLTFCPYALAYVGPGGGLSIIGSLLAFIAAILVAIFGFIWFPIRRRLRKKKLARAEAADDAGRQTAASSADNPDVQQAEQTKSEA